jgi:hypothetical protein
MPKVQRTSTGQSYMEPLGYVQLTAATAVGLGTVPDGTTIAMIQCETQNIRWRDDGTNPTTAVGQLLVANSTIFYSGTMSAFKMIEVVASTKVNVSFYR